MTAPDVDQDQVGEVVDLIIATLTVWLSKDEALTDEFYRAGPRQYDGRETLTAMWRIFGYLLTHEIDDPAGALQRLAAMKHATDSHGGLPNG